MTRRIFLRLVAGGLAIVATACGTTPTVTPTPTRHRPLPTAQLSHPTAAPTATKVPITSRPTVAPVLPTVTATSVPPTATMVPPTATLVPVKPTATPSTASMLSPDYGIHVFLGYTDAATRRDLELAKNGGFTWVKQRMDWDALAPDEQGQMKPDVLTRYDAIVDAVAASGLKLIVRIGSPPRWAASLKSTLVPYTKQPPANPPPDDLSPSGPFANFLYGLAKRYRGKVAAWQVWNEPNLYREWGRVPDPAQYAQLLKTAYHVIKAADPTMLVISAGMSPTGTMPPEALPDDVYLDQMYQALPGRSSNGYFDVLGAHGAGYKAPPEMDPAQVAQDKNYGGYRFFCFRRVEDLRAVMVKHGDSKKQIALLEFGWVIDGGEKLHPSYRWHAVSAETQADYIIRAFKWAKENWRPWIGVMTLIYILAPGFSETEEYYWWGITNPDGTPRPAYTRFKQWREAGN